MLTQTLTLSVCLAVTGQSISPKIQGNQPQVAVATYNNTIDVVDTVWWYNNNGTATVQYQRSGDTNPSAFSASGQAPDCDVDNLGNSIIVYQGPDPDNGNNPNNPSVFLVVNFGSPITVQTQAYNPKVTVSRTTGQIAIAWAGASNSGVSAATYSFNANNNQQTKTASQTTQPFQLNPNDGYRYSAPAIASDRVGNYVISYSKTYNGSASGVYVARYKYGTNTPLYSPSQINVTGQTQDVYLYTLTHVACWYDNGESVVVFNTGGSTNLISAHLASNGATLAGKAFLLDFPGNPPNALIYPEAGQAAVPGINSISVACLRGSGQGGQTDTSGDYMVTWTAQTTPNGEDVNTTSNIVFWKVVNSNGPDTESPYNTSTTPTFLTKWNEVSGYYPIFNISPSVAISDQGIYYLAWEYGQPSTPNNSGIPISNQMTTGTFP